MPRHFEKYNGPLRFCPAEGPGSPVSSWSRKASRPPTEFGIALVWFADGVWRFDKDKNLFENL